MSKVWVAMVHEPNCEGGDSSYPFGVYYSFEKAQNAVNVFNALSTCGEIYTVDAEFELDTLSNHNRCMLQEDLEIYDRLAPILDAAKELL